MVKTRLLRQLGQAGIGLVGKWRWAVIGIKTMASITDGMRAKASGCFLGKVTSVSVLLSFCFIVLLLFHCGIALSIENVKHVTSQAPSMA